MSQHRRLVQTILGVSAGLLLLAPAAHAQRLVEVSAGLEGTVARLGQLEETPFGFTGRFAVDFARRLGIELALIRFPQKVGGHFGERIWLVGGRFRVWRGDSRVYARVRAGRIFFGGAVYEEQFVERRHNAFDLGVTAESDLTPNFVWRIEAGDLIIPLSGEVYLEAGPPRVLGTTHNLMISTGVAFRF